MEVWICNTGESVSELNQIIQGHQDGELTEAGHIQSKLLGNRIKFAKFNEIISSDLNRAKETTKQILSFRDEVPVTFDGRLREKAAGVFEGKKLYDYRKEAIKSGNLREFRPQGGENWLDVLDRANDVLNELILKYVKIDFAENGKMAIEENNQNDKSIVNSKTQNHQQNKLRKMQTISPVYKDNSLKKYGSIIIDSKKLMLPLKKMSSVIIEKEQISIDYKSIDCDNLFKNEGYLKRMSKIYRGFDPDLNFSRVLLVTHGGFIMEFLNLIRIRRNIRIKFINDSKPSSLYILKIYCINCGYVCYSKDSNCRLEYDMILFNDVEHLNLNE